MNSLILESRLKVLFAVNPFHFRIVANLPSPLRITANGKEVNF